MRERRPLNEALRLILIRIITVIIGIINIIIIPRYMSQYEYGLYSFIINRFSSILDTVQSIYRFWVFRELARGINTFPNGLLLTIMYSVFSSLTTYYILVAVYNVDIVISAGGALVVALIMLGNYARTCNDVYRPVVSQVSIFAIRAGTAISAIALLMFYGSLELYNLIYLLIIIHIASLLPPLYALRGKMRGAVEGLLSSMRRWKNKSPLPLMASASIIIAGLDAYVVAYLYGFDDVALFFVPLGIVNVIVGLSSVVMRPLTSYILSTEDSRGAVHYVYAAMLVAVPLAVFVAWKAEEVLGVYGDHYSDYYIVLTLLSPYAVLVTIRSALISVAVGSSSEDVYAEDFGGVRATKVYSVYKNELKISIVYISTFIFATYVLPNLYLITWPILATCRILFSIFVQERNVDKNTVRGIVRDLSLILLASITSMIITGNISVDLKTGAPLASGLMDSVASIALELLAFLLAFVAVGSVIDAKLRRLVARMYANVLSLLRGRGLAPC